MAPGCLGCIGDYTTQSYGDFNKPIQGSLKTNQYNGKLIFLPSFFSLPPREAHCYSMTDDEDHSDDDKADDCVASWVDQPVGINGLNGSE